MRHTTSILLGAVLLLGALAVQPGCAGDPRAGDRAPNVTLLGMDDRSFDLESLRGDTVLLNFWFYQ